jgi:hypothetical protein
VGWQKGGPKGKGQWGETFFCLDLCFFLSRERNSLRGNERRIIYSGKTKHEKSRKMTGTRLSLSGDCLIPYSNNVCFAKTFYFELSTLNQVPLPYPA